MNIEYITIDEALKITGLAEKTLKEHLRGRVPMIGKSSWSRKEFFDHWRKEFEIKQQKVRQKNEVLENFLKEII